MPHKLPNDLKKVLHSSPKILALWNNISPLAKNEWICWVISPVKTETRERRLRRTREELLEGKKRPCCWAGCPHR